MNQSALFKITSRCNDNCKFCIEKKFIKIGRDDLSPEEIKNNFEYLKKNYNLDYVIITGGEPTLHPDFLKILECFSNQKIEFRIITNLLKFGDKNFSKKVLPHFKKANRIIGSINDLPINETAVRRIEGLKNILESKLPVMLIIVVYKDNLESLAELILYLVNLFKKYKYDKSINIELRLMYIEGMLKSLLKDSLPTDFKKIKKSIRQAVNTADLLKVTTTLWNFPLCYLDKVPRLHDKTVFKRRQRKLFKINKDFQLADIQIRDFEEYFKKSKDCLNCLYNDCCSGIDNIYITKYHFPKFRPFV